MKKFLIVLAALFAVVVLTACDNNDQKKVAVSLDSNDTYRIQWLEAFKELAESKGYTVISTNADRNASKQISDIEGLVLQKPDAIFVHLNSGAENGVQTAYDAGIPVILIDFSAAEGTDYTTQIRDGQLIAGITQGEYIKDWLDADSSRVANIGYVIGSYSAAAIERRDGVYQVLEIPKISGDNSLATQFIGQENAAKTAKVIIEGNAEWSGVKAQELVDAWLSAHPTINVIIGMSDQIALGVIESLKTAGKNLDNYLVLGIDGSDDAKVSLLAGELDMTVARDLAKEVAVAFETMEKILNGETVDQLIQPEAMTAMTKEDLE